MIEKKIETTILHALLHDDEFFTNVMQHLQINFFINTHRVLFYIISEYTKKHFNKRPTQDEMKHILQNSNISDSEFSKCYAVLEQIGDPKFEEYGHEWLMEESESWCKRRSLELAVDEVYKILNDEKTTRRNEMPNILQNALAMSFDTSIGHDYFEDAGKRWDFHQKTDSNRIRFGLSDLDFMTQGGLLSKTLMVVMGGTAVGKSMFMTNHASNCLKPTDDEDGKNVLYISLEMSEERVVERIDANILDIDVNDLYKVNLDNDINKQREFFIENVDGMRVVKKKGVERKSGKLFVKEYPPSEASVVHFRALIENLKRMKGFTPDIIFIDYLNIANSSKIKLGGSVNSYTMVKKTAEEFRALAVEYDIPIVSATQTTREGFQKIGESISMTDTSESFGLPATCDYMIFLSKNQDDNTQMIVTQLKNRYADIETNKSFSLGINRERMKFYDNE